jgi:transcriptional regulator of aromatic amino acid metabolism
VITDFNVQRWLESSPQESHSEHVVVNGQNFCWNHPVKANTANGC